MSDQNSGAKDINSIIDRLGTLHLSTKGFLREKNAVFTSQQNNLINELYNNCLQLSVLTDQCPEYTPSFVLYVEQFLLFVEDVIELDAVIEEWKTATNTNNDKAELLGQASNQRPGAYIDEKMILYKLDLYTARLQELSTSMQNLEEELVSINSDLMS